MCHSACTRIMHPFHGGQYCDCVFQSPETMVLLCMYVAVVCMCVSVYIHAYISWQLATKVTYAPLRVVACPCLRDCVAPPPRFEDIHSQLVPYLLTIGSFALEHGTSAIRPLAKHDSWLNKVRTTETLKLWCPC